MEIDRRKFVLGSCTLVGSLANGASVPFEPFGPSSAQAASDDVLLASACRIDAGGFALVIVNQKHEVVRSIPLAARGHDVTSHRPTGKAVVFARRPGRFAIAFEPRTVAPAKLITPPADRHFYGHGVFSRDGRRLFSTENDYEHARGVIGVYDASGSYQRIDEFDSHGVGPHDVALMPNGRTLAIANGGIETHPDSGRTKLNIASMEPSICFVDSHTGDLIVRHRLASGPDQLSLRHIAVTASGDVWFGGQWEGSAVEAPELIGFCTQDGGPQMVAGQTPLGIRLKGYIGSVSVSQDGRWLAASAPRAGQIVYIDTEGRSVRRISKLHDGCGVAALSGREFAVSSGDGLLRRETADGGVLDVANFDELAFDNHMHRL